jgi:hypothetical protein
MCELLVMMKVEMSTFDGSHPDDGRDVIRLGGHSHNLPTNILLSRRRRRRTDALTAAGHGCTVIVAKPVAESKLALSFLRPDEDSDCDDGEGARELI